MGNRATRVAAGGAGLALGRKNMKPIYRFIDKHLDQPFFIWFAPMLPHGPFNAPEKYKTLYQGKGYSSSAVDYYANCSWYDAVLGGLRALRQVFPAKEGVGAGYRGQHRGMRYLPLSIQPIF